ncbi:MAG: peptidase C45 [Anaerolineales bacterium]|nr:peptidase C45 [Anaerolineales bacterium]
MTKQHFPRIRVQGLPFERGRQYGQQAASRIQRNIEIYREMFAHYAGWDWPQATSHAQTFGPAIAAYRPHFLDEMRGIAEGAGVSYEDILALNVRTEIRNFAIAKSAPGECSSFVVLPPATENNHTLIGQNWDWVVPVSDTVVVLEVEADDVPNFVTVVEAGLLAKTGMNAAGIGMTTNALHSDLESNAVPGIPYHVILRAILESGSFSDAIAAINGHVRASSANYTVAHRDGEAFNAETAPGDFSRAYISFPETNVYAHTNHYLCRDIDFRDVGVWHGPDSLVRHRRLSRFLRTHPDEFTVSDLQRALADHFDFPNSVCCHPDPRDPAQEHFQTVTSVIMDLKTATLWIAAGNPCEVGYTEIPYEDLLGVFQKS